MEIDRSKLEHLTTSLAIVLLTIIVVVLTLVVANQIFSWDLFPPLLEKVGGLMIAMSFLIIFSSVIINIMLNIGRIADSFDKSDPDKKTHGEIRID